MKKLLILILVIWSQCAFSSVKLDNWSQCTTDRFTVLTDHNKHVAGVLCKDVDLFINHFERFIGRKVIDTLNPIKIYAFKWSNLYKLFASSESSIGEFQSSPYGNTIILSAHQYKSKKSRHHKRPTLFHELSHYLIQKSGDDFNAAWYTEGLALYLETAHFSDETVSYGLPSRQSLKALSYYEHKKKSIPLKEALNLGSHYHSKATEYLYPTLSAFFSYTLSSKELKESWIKFISEQKSGKTILESWEASYSSSIDDFAVEISKFIKSYKFKYKYYNHDFELPKHDIIKLSKKQAFSELFELSQVKLSVNHPAFKYFFEESSKKKQPSKQDLYPKAVHYLKLNDWENLEKHIENIKAHQELEHLSLAIESLAISGQFNSTPDNTEENFKLAINKARRSIRLNNTSQLGFLALGEAYFSYHSIDPKISLKEGIVGYSELLYFSNTPEIRLKLALLLEKDNRIDDAIHYYRSLLSEDRLEEIQKLALRKVEELSPEK